LGAGRRTKDDAIDFLAGIRLLKKVGEPVRAGEALAVLYTSREALLDAAEERFLGAITVTEQKPDARPHVFDVIA
ncbi:MAG: thymidine phosphorylase, partial [Clostridia bacterium]|nr:thymidine phosphorylase [Clostridia bacterium]